VRRADNGQWNVCEQGDDKPLASFDQEQDARDYAHGISQSKSDRIEREEAAANSQITGV